MKKMKITYKRKVFIGAFAVCAVCMFITSFIVWRSASNIFLEKYKSKNLMIMRSASEEIDRTFNVLIRQMNIIENSSVFLGAKEAGNSNDLGYYVDMSALFFEQRQLNSAISSIYYYRNDGMLFYDYTLNSRNQNISVEDEVWYDDTLGVSPYILWTPCHSQNVFKQKDNNVITASKVITGRNGNCGILVINLYDKYFQNLFQKISSGESGNTYIVKDNIIMAKSEDTEQVYSEFENESGSFEKGKNIISYQSIESNGWYLVYSIKRSEALNSKELLIDVSTISFLIGLILAFVFMYFNVSWLTKPIHEFMSVIERVRNGNLNERWDCKSKNAELREMSDGFNCMVDSVNSLLNKVENGYRLNQELNIQVLEEQLNSHFLYNVLNSIYYTTEAGEHEITAKMTYALAEFVRHSLNKGKRYMSFEEELEHVKNYIFIEKFRYMDKFDIKYEIDENTLSVIVPKIILQPLVENSIIHGIFERDCGGMIIIRSKTDGRYIYIEIYDNGVGMDKYTLDKLNSDKIDEIPAGTSKGFAIRNLKKRLELNYDDYDMKIESEENKYTSVKLRLEIKNFE